MDAFIPAPGLAVPGQTTGSRGTLFSAP